VVASRGVTERHAGRLVAPIHPSAWNSNSAKFALLKFCERRIDGVLRSSQKKVVKNTAIE
jgi:hypothetical protein